MIPGPTDMQPPALSFVMRNVKRGSGRAVVAMALVLIVGLVPAGSAAPPGPVRCAPPDPYFASTLGIRFASDRAGNQDVYETRSDPSATPKNATNDPGPDSGPSAQNGPGLVAWVSERDGNPEIYCMEVGFYNAVNLTQDAGIDTSPS